jgi:hypothetical protein
MAALETPTTTPVTTLTRLPDASNIPLAHLKELADRHKVFQALYEKRHNASTSPTPPPSPQQQVKPSSDTQGNLPVIGPDPLIEQEFSTNYQIEATLPDGKKITALLGGLSGSALDPANPNHLYSISDAKPGKIEGALPMIAKFERDANGNVNPVGGVALTDENGNLLKTGDFETLKVSRDAEGKLIFTAIAEGEQTEDGLPIAPTTISTFDEQGRRLTLTALSPSAHEGLGKNTYEAWSSIDPSSPIHGASMESTGMFLSESPVKGTNTHRLLFHKGETETGTVNITSPGEGWSARAVVKHPSKEGVFVIQFSKFNKQDKDNNVPFNNNEVLLTELSVTADGKFVTTNKVHLYEDPKTVPLPGTKGVQTSKLDNMESVVFINEGDNIKAYFVTDNNFNEKQDQFISQVTFKKEDL